MTWLTDIQGELHGLPSGAIPEQLGRRVETWLYTNWKNLTGSRDGGMKADKLIGRIENLQWMPPIISFQIERHGAAVMGSIYAELQKWSIDVSTGDARLGIPGRRRIGVADTRLNVKPIAAAIAAAIVEGREDERLVWPTSNRVRVLMAVVIPLTNKETTANRRRRLVAELARMVQPDWTLVPAGSHTVFVRATENA